MAAAVSGPTEQSAAKWSKDSVEHLRTVHFTLIAVCVALFFLSLAQTKTEVVTALDQLRQVRELLRNFDPRWFDTDVGKRVSLQPKGANVLIITAEDVSIHSPFELHDNAILRVPASFESKLFDQDTLEAVPITTLFRKENTLKQFRNMWDMLHEAYVEVPTDLSARAYVDRPFEYQHKIRAPVKFDKLDHPPQSPYALQLRIFSPRALELVRAQDPTFDGEIYYGGQFPAVGHGGKVGADVEVWIPVDKSTRLSKYDGQAVLLSHAGPNWDWQHGSFDASFRELNEVTKDYQDIDLDAMERIVRSEAQRTGESFELVGMKLSAEQALRWGILVIIVIQLYFWLHLIELAPKQRDDGSGWDVAWIGVYRSGYARAVMLLTTILLPGVVVGRLGIRGLHISFTASPRLLLLAITLAPTVFLGIKTWSLLPRAEGERDSSKKEGPMAPDTKQQSTEQTQVPNTQEANGCNPVP